jgi:hypothetical protein
MFFLQKISFFYNFLQTKSGAMRLGNDLIVFTKKNEELTILFLSRDFLGAEKLKSIIICLPSFSETTKEPIYSLDEGGRENKIKVISYLFNFTLKINEKLSVEYPNYYDSMFSKNLLYKFRSSRALIYRLSFLLVIFFKLEYASF